MFNNAINLDLFSGFKVSSPSLVITNLWYATDTIILEENTINNQWLIKNILRDFELAFGLRGNFAKINLIRACEIQLHGLS